MSGALLTVVGLRGVSLSPAADTALSPEISLREASETLLSAGDLQVMSAVQRHAMRHSSWFLVQRTVSSIACTPNAEACYETIQDALMALQIVKPVETDGFFFQGDEQPNGAVRWHGTSIRWPMTAGRWAQMRTFDDDQLTIARSMLDRVRAVMSGSEIAKKNAMHLLQLALEHPHPYVACLLAVTGMEAIFDSKDRWDFENKLCTLLGPSALAFPDWNSPDIPPLTYTVKDVAVHLYTLRSKIAHGANLVKAAQDKSCPVDLLQLKDYISQGDPVRYAVLLGEAAIYLLGHVLQKVL
jgi:hypothetical protein